MYHTFLKASANKKKNTKAEVEIPSHDTFGDIFAAIEPKALHECFAEWVEIIRENISGEIVAIDGKSIRRSKDTANDKNVS